MIPVRPAMGQKRVGGSVPESLGNLFQACCIGDDQQSPAALQYALGNGGQHPFHRLPAELVEVDLHCPVLCQWRVRFLPFDVPRPALVPPPHANRSDDPREGQWGLTTSNARSTPYTYKNKI